MRVVAPVAKRAIPMLNIHRGRLAEGALGEGDGAADGEAPFLAGEGHDLEGLAADKDDEDLAADHDDVDDDEEVVFGDAFEDVETIVKTAVAVRGV